MVLVATSVGILGFTICIVLVLLCVPIGLFTTIQTLWSWSAIGNTRKLLTTALILLLWWTLPLLAFLLLAWSWAVVGILLETAIWVLPPVFIFLACYLGIRGSATIRQSERAKRQTADDISFEELALVLVVALASFAVTGSSLFWLTLIKSPFVFVGIMYHGSCTALHWILSLRDRIGAWVLLWLIFFGVAFCLAMPCVGLAIAVACLFGVTVATLWPPYVAHYGWPGQQRQSLFSKHAITDACKAAYQVVWIADFLTNAAMFGRADVAREIFQEARRGQRFVLPLASKSIAFLPLVEAQYIGTSASFPELLDIQATSE